MNSAMILQGPWCLPMRTCSWSLALRYVPPCTETASPCAINLLTSGCLILPAPAVSTLPSFDGEFHRERSNCPRILAKGFGTRTSRPPTNQLRAMHSPQFLCCSGVVMTATNESVPERRHAYRSAVPPLCLIVWPVDRGCREDTAWTGLCI